MYGMWSMFGMCFCKLVYSFTICHSVIYDLTDTSLSSNGMIHNLNLLVLDTCKQVFWQTVKIVFIIANSADPDGTLPYVYRYPK